MDCHATLPLGSFNRGDNITPGRAALRDFNPAYDRFGVKLGHSAMSAQMSGLPESGHGWTIYEYTP
jgi:hypothetical protein